jgi:ABC-type branched-subunit amino acid transport system substrate-binding protein
MLRFWRRLRRIRRSNLVVTTILIVLLVLFQVLGSQSEAEIFSAPEVVDRSPQTPIIIPPGEPIVLGYSGPLTGALSDETPDFAIAGVLGWKELNGDEIHGHPIDLVAEDDGGVEADIAVTAARLLIDRPRLVGIVGPAFSGAAAAAVDIYNAAGVVAVSGSATRTDLTLSQPQPSFFFRTAFTNAAEGPLQAQILIDRLGTGTAFIIDQAEPFSLDLAISAQSELLIAGWTAVRSAVPTGTVDFTSLVSTILEIAPDAVLFEGFNPDGALLLGQLRDAGYAGLFLGGDALVSQSAFIDVLGEEAEGAVFTGCAVALSDQFNRIWFEGGAPGLPSISLSGNTADAAFLLMAAIAEVAEPLPDGSLRIDPVRLRDAVAATDMTGWATGQHIAFDRNGDRVGLGEEAGLVACEVQGGVFVEVTS